MTSNRSERLEPGSVLETERRPLEVVASRPHQHRHLVQFDGIADRTAAESLRGTVLRAPALADEEVFWVHELVGAAMVTVTGREVGAVVAVEANPASDLLVDEHGHLVPLVFVVDQRNVDGRVEIVVDAPAGLLD